MSSPGQEMIMINRYFQEDRMKSRRECSTWLNSQIRFPLHKIEEGFPSSHTHWWPQFEILQFPKWRRATWWMSADVRACVYSIPVVASPQKVSIAVWNLVSSFMIFPAFPLIDFAGWQKNFIQITSFQPKYPLLNPPLSLKPGIPGMPRWFSLKIE